MKAHTLILIVLFLFDCTGKKVKNDLLKDNLKGRISKITISYYSGIEKFGEIQKDNLWQKYIKKYDTKGKMTEMSDYNSQGDLTRKEAFEYDENGNMTKKTLRDVLMEKSNNSYLFGNEPGVIVFKYNNNGKMVEENSYKLDGSLIRKTTYTYKEYFNKNKIVEMTSVNSDDVILTSFDNKEEKVKSSSKDVFEYDNIGNLISHDNYWLGMLMFKMTYKYDNEDRIIEHCKYDSKGKLTSEETYLYDSRGNQIEKNELGSRNTFKYDKKGFIIEECGYNSDKTLGSKINYIYDQIDNRGNWLKRTETGFRGTFRNKNGEDEPLMSTNIEEQDIDYY